MEEFGNNDKSEVYSKAVRAGKRTYFFDVKATRSEEMYLTITESKRKFDPQSEKFYYEKHKLFLYKEDFDKFSKGLDGMINFIRTGDLPEEEEINYNTMDDVDFDKLSDDNFNSI